jgi:hypothetical protein
MIFSEKSETFRDHAVEHRSVVASDVHSDAHEADDCTHRHEHDKPVAAINPYQPHVAHREAGVHENRGNHESEPTALTGQAATAAITMAR